MSKPTAPPKAEVYDRNITSGLSMLLLVAAAIGIIGSCIGAYLNLQQFAYSWLFAFMYFYTLCAGCLFWVLVHHATDAEWSVVVRRVLENVAGLVPIALLFLLPLLIFCIPILWKWWSIAPGIDAVLDKKRGYLNHTFFIIRYIGYFVALTCVALGLKRNSIAQDTDGSPRRTLVMRKLAVAGIPLFAVSLTFGAVDWLMGLDYHWFSTMWGVYIFAGTGGASMSLLVLIVTALRKRGYLQAVTIEHYHIMGKLMLAFCIFWAYIGFSQYMLIWYSNLPEETGYFIRRNIESWWYLSTTLVVFRFFVPLPLLLMQWTKKTLPVICGVAILIVVMQMLDIYIIVLPMLHKDGVSPSILDITSLLAIGPTLAFLFLRALPQSNLIPMRDPRLPESLRLTN